MVHFCYLRFVIVFVIYCLFCSLQPCDGVGLLGLLCVLFCAFVTFPYGVLDQEWYLIVSIPDLCLLPYVNKFLKTETTIEMKYQKHITGHIHSKATKNKCVSGNGLNILGG